MEAITGTLAFAAVFLFAIHLMLILLLPPFLYLTVAYFTVSRARRVSWVAASAGAALFATIPFFAWQWQRSHYRQEAEAIQSRIAEARPSEQSKDLPAILLIRDQSFSWHLSTNPGELGCFERIFADNDRSIVALDTKQRFPRASLPQRYLELDSDDRRHSPFGDRKRTRGRGPYELWLWSGRERKLIDVYFMGGDGLSSALLRN